jgi:hypothetical protein
MDEQEAFLLAELLALKAVKPNFFQTHSWTKMHWVSRMMHKALKQKNPSSERIESLNPDVVIPHVLNKHALLEPCLKPSQLPHPLPFWIFSTTKNHLHRIFHPHALFHHAMPRSSMALLSICDVTFKDRLVAILHSAFSTLLAYKLISFRGEVAAPPLRHAGLILAQYFCLSYCDFYIGILTGLRPSVEIMLVSPFETIDAVITRYNREFLGNDPENCCRDMLFLQPQEGGVGVSRQLQRDHTVARCGIGSHSILALWHPLRQSNQGLG